MRDGLESFSPDTVVWIILDINCIFGVQICLSLLKFNDIIEQRGE